MEPAGPARSLHRPAPGPLPSWAEPDYVAHNVAEFTRTGFHGALNYYRAAEPYFYMSAAWKGAKITQPWFYIPGKADSLRALYPPLEKLRMVFPASREYRARQCGPLDTTRSLCRSQRTACEVRAYGKPCLKERAMAAALALTDATFHLATPLNALLGGRTCRRPIDDLPSRLARDWSTS